MAPKSHAYVSALPSGSTASAVKSTFNGTVPLSGVAEAFSCGVPLPVTPGPLNVNSSRSMLAPVKTT